MKLLIWHRNVYFCLWEAYRFQRSILGPHDMTVLSTLDAIADIMAWNNESDSALEYYKTVLRLLRTNHNSSSTTRPICVLLYKMHRIQFDKGDIDAARKTLTEAQLLLKQCSELDAQSYALEKKIENDMEKIEKQSKICISEEKNDSIAIDESSKIETIKTDDATPSQFSSAQDQSKSITGINSSTSIVSKKEPENKYSFWNDKIKCEQSEVSTVKNNESRQDSATKYPSFKTSDNQSSQCRDSISRDDYHSNSLNRTKVSKSNELAKNLEPMFEASAEEKMKHDNPKTTSNNSLPPLHVNLNKVSKHIESQSLSSFEIGENLVKMIDDALDSSCCDLSTVSSTESLSALSFDSAIHSSQLMFTDKKLDCDDVNQSNKKLELTNGSISIIPNNTHSVDKDNLFDDEIDVKNDVMQVESSAIEQKLNESIVIDLTATSSKITTIKEQHNAIALDSCENDQINENSTLTSDSNNIIQAKSKLNVLFKINATSKTDESCRDENDMLKQPKSKSKNSIPTGSTQKDNPDLSKYFKMLKVGMPHEVVKHAMKRDGIDPAVLNDKPLPKSEAIAEKTINSIETPTQTNSVALKNDPRFTKFFKMLKVVMPRETVKHAMKRDGYDSAILDGDPNLPAVMSKDYETTPQSQQKKNIRRTRVHWDTLCQKVKSGSVWALLQEDQDNIHIDDLEIKQLFEAEADIKPVAHNNKKSNNDDNLIFNSPLHEKDGNQSSDTKVRSGSKKKMTSVKIIDPKRANNGGIILARIKINFDELARVVDKMDDSNLTQQQLQGIIEYLPTQKEIKSFNEYFSDCKSYEEKKQLINKMCECEKFMVAIMNVQEAEKKIRTLIFRMEFENNVRELEQDATLIDDACSELSSSLRLRKLLGIVLNVGNRVNMGAATGFSITSLLKLNHAKSMDKKTTFLHYVVKVAKRNDESILEFKEELPSVFKAEKVFWDHCLNGVKGLEDHLNNIKSLVLASVTNRSSVQSIPNDKYDSSACETNVLSSTFVGQFVLDAVLKIKELRQRIDKANQSYTNLLQYFHEEALRSHDFFNIFVQFSRNVDAAKVEIKMEEKGKQQWKRMSLNKSNSISNINIGKDHNMKHTLYRGRKYLTKCQSTSNLSINESNDEDHLEEMSEIKLQQSASHHYNSVIAELKAKASPRRINV